MANFYIGWDVGAWKCTKGKNDSCDAIVVMDDNRIIGHHRANLGNTIRQLYEACAAVRISLLVKQWFSLCRGTVRDKGYSHDDHYYIAIDTPLGWPRDFKGLLNSCLPDEWDHKPEFANIRNTLLYRYTEREKLKSGLSVIVDSIGSQSTKGILLLQLLGATNGEWGIWKAGNITLFETYPKACLVRAGFVGWLAGLNLKQKLAESFRVQVTKKDEKPKKYRTEIVIAEDVFDAVVCACVAKAFANRSPKLVAPTASDPIACKPEGWIFYPDQEESVASQKVADSHKKVTCCEGIKTFAEAIKAFQKHVKSKPPTKQQP